MVFLTAAPRDDTCYRVVVDAGVQPTWTNPGNIPRFLPSRTERCQLRLARLSHAHLKHETLYRFFSAGSVKRHCLEKGDEEGKLCDLNPAQPSPASAPAGLGRADGPDTVQSQSQVVPVSVAIPAAAAHVECETELEGICATTESVLAPVWAEDVEGVSETSSIGFVDNLQHSVRDVGRCARALTQPCVLGRRWYAGPHPATPTRS